MSRRNLAIASAAICSAVLSQVPALNAETLAWTGKYSEIWDLSERNWTNSVGEEVAFSNGSDAFFGDAAESFTIRFTNNVVRAGTVVFDTAGTYSLTNAGSGQYLYSAASIRKRGEGRLNVCPKSSILLHEAGEGIFVDEGTAVFSGQSSLSYFRKKSDMVFFAGTNATLNFAMRNIFNSDMTETVTAPVVVKDGTFIASDTGGHMKVGPITLDNATFDFSGLRGYIGYGIMTFSGKLTFKGTTPYELLQEHFLANDANKNFRHFSLWSEPKTEFSVDDITGDGSQDVTIGAKLSDHCTNHTPAVATAPGGLVKSGPGTLALTNSLNTFGGDIEVREGVLQVGPNLQLHALSMVKNVCEHWIGNLANEGRKVVVKSGASLYLPNRNCFGQQLGITNIIEDMNVKFVFDGGTFTNYDGQGFLLPDLEFSNGGSIAPGCGPSGYGRFMVQERFSVSGNVPFVWNLSQAAKTNNGRMSQEALALNGYPENVFDIADVTGDAQADATFGIPFMIAQGYFRNDTDTGNHFLDDWKFGFRKTGPGTMRIAAPKISIGKSNYTNSLLTCRSFNGDPKIEEGELRVDGDLSLSDTVRVFVGAGLSGTGQVNNVSIASGGFLRVPDGQADFLRIGGDLSAEGGMKVECVLAAGADVRNVRAKILSVSGEVEGLDSLLSAPVLVDGEPVPNIVLRFNGGVLDMRYMRGTTVVVR